MRAGPGGAEAVGDGLQGIGGAQVVRQYAALLGAQGLKLGKLGSAAGGGQARVVVDHETGSKC